MKRVKNPMREIERLVDAYWKRHPVRLPASFFDELLRGFAFQSIVRDDLL